MKFCDNIDRVISLLHELLDLVPSYEINLKPHEKRYLQDILKWVQKAYMEILIEVSLQINKYISRYFFDRFTLYH